MLFLSCLHSCQWWVLRCQGAMRIYRQEHQAWRQSLLLHWAHWLLYFSEHCSFYSLFVEDNDAIMQVFYSFPVLIILFFLFPTISFFFLNYFKESQGLCRFELWSFRRGKWSRTWTWCLGEWRVARRCRKVNWL